MSLNILIGIYSIGVIVFLILHLVTSYHFIKFRYQGDASKIIVVIFTILMIGAAILPFFIYDYNSTNLFDKPSDHIII